MPKIEIETNYYIYDQNNSGSEYLLNDRDGIGHVIAIEARDYEDANNRLDDITSSYSEYCHCCGERWSKFDNEPKKNNSKFDNLDDVKIYLKIYFKYTRQEDPKAFLHDYHNSILLIEVKA